MTANPRREEVVIADLLDRRARETPGRPFAIFSGETWDYATTAGQVWEAAQGFVDLGVRPGDYVASWLPTDKEALKTWFGVNAAGAVYAPINLAYRGRILEHTLNIAGASVLVAHVDLVDRLVGLELPHLRTVVVVGIGAPSLPGLKIVSWSAFLRPGAGRPQLADPVEPWDEMALIYTSGTTGTSKGVRCSYLHHFTFSQNHIPPEIGPDDRFFVCLPMFHVSGTIPTYTMLQRGASIVVTHGFKTKTFWDDVRTYRVTTACLMAAMANFLHKQPPGDRDADNPLRIAYMAPMIEDIDGFSRRFGVSLYTTYAMTEVPAVTRTELNPKDARQCGRLVDPDNYELRVVDEHDQEVAPGTVGEAVVRHTRPWSLNSGYKAMPDATAEAWRNGWFHTGDAVYRDEEGNFYFVDRLKDSLRRRGENVSSIEVERELLAYPAVHEASVVAVTSDLQEDEIKAVITLREGASLDESKLIEFLIPRLPYFMVPRYIEVVDALPKTPTLKILKTELRARGLTPTTWDREAAGIRLRREQLPPT